LAGVESGLPEPGFPVLWRRWKCISPPSRKAQLAQIAANAGTDPERLVKDAALRLIEGPAGFRAVSPGSVVAEMRALRARVKPDPEGWTTRDYVHYGRR
jgi:hypothetical protein